MKCKELWNTINDQHSRLFFNLKERWMNEREYEDIQEYLKVIQKSVPQAKSIRKDPFGITCVCEDGKLDVNVVIKGRSMSIQGKVRCA